MSRDGQSHLLLYHALASSASRKVRFCLAEKHLHYDERLISILDHEQLEEWYLRIHPEGIVPALEIDGRVFVDSNLINEYLDARFPGPPLRPDSAEERYELQRWSQYIDTVIRRAVVKFNFAHAISPIIAKWSDEKLEKILNAIPTEERRQLWWRTARKPYTEPELTAAIELLLHMADEIECRLEESKWLFGGRFGLGEINTTPYVKRLSEIDPEAVSNNVRPGLADWWQRIIARPAYAQSRIENFNPRR